MAMKFTIALDKALEALEKNSQAHTKELFEANEVWIERVKAGLDKLKDVVNREGLKSENTALASLFYNKPQDNRLQYSRIIGAISQSILAGQTTIEVEEEEYDRIFNDNFEWRVRSKTSNAAYSK